MTRQLQSVSGGASHCVSFLSSSRALVRGCLCRSYGPNDRSCAGCVQLRGVMDLASSPRLQVCTFSARSGMSRFVLLEGPGRPRIVSSYHGTTEGTISILRKTIDTRLLRSGTTLRSGRRT